MIGTHILFIVAAGRIEKKTKYMTLQCKGGPQPKKMKYQNMTAGGDYDYKVYMNPLGR